MTFIQASRGERESVLFSSQSDQDKTQRNDAAVTKKTANITTGKDKKIQHLYDIVRNISLPSWTSSSSSSSSQEVELSEASVSSGVVGRLPRAERWCWRTETDRISSRAASTPSSSQSTALHWERTAGLLTGDVRFKIRTRSQRTDTHTLSGNRWWRPWQSKDPVEQKQVQWRHKVLIIK